MYCNTVCLAMHTPRQNGRGAARLMHHTCTALPSAFHFGLLERLCLHECCQRLMRTCPACCCCPQAPSSCQMMMKFTCGRPMQTSEQVRASDCSAAARMPAGDHQLLSCHQGTQQQQQPLVVPQQGQQQQEQQQPSRPRRRGGGGLRMVTTPLVVVVTTSSLLGDRTRLATQDT